jgi:quinol monooxygenase YgiN
MNAGYGMHARITATEGSGDRLAAVLLQAADALTDNDGCLLYLVSREAGHDDVVTVTEMWQSRAAHDDSLKDPRVADLVARGRPLIASFQASELRPAGGKGL